MRNILSVLKRDLLRLVKTPAAVVVVIALLILPSAYTWYNVVGFWNPYENTSAMRVAVVNQDKGGQSDLTGEINVGQTMVEELSSNTQLAWCFDDYDTAMADLAAGRDYAVFVIPEDFTSNLLSLTTGDFTQPKIQYYVNEKTGPVAPKVTDTGANTLERTIDSTFVETVSNALVETMDQAIDQTKVGLLQADSEATAKINEAVAAIAQTRASVQQAQSSLAAAQQKVAPARASLDDVIAKLDLIDAGLVKLQGSTEALQKELPDSISAGLSDLSDAVSQLESIGDITGDSASVKQAIANIQTAINLLNDGVVPELMDALSRAVSSIASLEALTDEQKVMVQQAQYLLTQVDETLGVAANSLSQTDALLAGLQDDLPQIRSDLSAIAKSSLVSKLVEGDDLDAGSIAEFMGSPTQVRTEHLYSLNAYGSAMAPLFMNLTFWIGAFCLLVIMRQEVDDEGIEKLSLTQRYLSRFVLFAVLAVLQSVICCAGCIFLGVQVVNAPALFLAAAVASLAYLSIIYALSVVLQHIGKGVCIVLVFIQIPAATGLYPVEMTAPFYKAISPFFPFTYGISAMRESICGFYGLEYAHSLAMLMVFFFAFMFLGIFVRPLMANVNRMTAHQVQESGIFNGESVEVPERRFTFSQIMRIVVDKEEYRASVQGRFERIEARYPRIIRWAIILGIAVPVIVGIVATLTTAAKVVVLTVWLVWIIVLFIFLVVVENIRYKLRRQLDADGISSDDLIQRYADPGRVVISGQGKSGGDGNA